MTPRLLWFAAGSAAGIYASVKAKRAAYRLTPPGLIDQASALGAGWRAFSAEMRDGMHERERDIAHELSLPVEHPYLEHDQIDHTRYELRTKEQH